MQSLLKILRHTHTAVSWCKLLPTVLLILLLLLLSLRNLNDGCACAFFLLPAGWSPPPVQFT